MFVKPTQPPLSSPAQVSQRVQMNIQSALEGVLTRARSSAGEAALPMSLRVRDWSLSTAGSTPKCEVFLDKGNSWLSLPQFQSRPGHIEQLQSGTVSIDECLIFHRALMEDEPIMEWFADNVVFEVGSAGDEPPLRSFEDFKAAQGLFIKIQTWTNESGRAKRKGRLVGVDRGSDTSEPPLITLESGSGSIRFLLPSIRKASLLLFHPENLSAR
jgi:ribosome maturation factor RimP